MKFLIKLILFLTYILETIMAMLLFLIGAFYLLDDNKKYYIQTVFKYNSQNNIDFILISMFTIGISLTLNNLLKLSDEIYSLF